jgi:hypothetical protein
MTSKIAASKRNVVRLSAGWVEQVVRFLIGLPIATAYFYARHFDMTWAYAFLAAGLILLIAGLAGDDSSVESAPAARSYAHAS